jgi:hypothetical protein
MPVGVMVTATEVGVATVHLQEVLLRHNVLLHRNVLLLVVLLHHSVLLTADHQLLPVNRRGEKVAPGGTVEVAIADQVTGVEAVLEAEVVAMEVEAGAAAVALEVVAEAEAVAGDVN